MARSQRGGLGRAERERGAGAAARRLLRLLHGDPRRHHRERGRARDRARPVGASLTDLQWIVDGYTVAFAGLLLLGGALGDRWGHRRVFCLGVAVFTVSSLGCAVAGNALVLTAFRLARGLRRRTARARLARLAAAGLPHAVGPGAGLRAVGRDRGRGGHRGPARRRGADHHGGVALGLRHQPARRRRCASCSRWPRSGRPRATAGRVIDPLGQAAVVVTVAAAHRRAQRGGPPGHRRARGHRRRRSSRSSAAGVLVLRERFGAHPPLPLPMVRSRPVSGGTAIGLLFNFGFYGMIFAASVYFQQHLNLSAALAGLALLPAMAVTMVASALSGRLSRPLPAPAPHARSACSPPCVGLALWAVVGRGRELPGPRRRHDRLRLRHVVHPHRGDLHGDGRGPARATRARRRRRSTRRGRRGRRRASRSAARSSRWLGLPAGVTTFMAVGAAGYLLGAVLTALCVPR